MGYLDGLFGDSGGRTPALLSAPAAILGGAGGGGGIASIGGGLGDVLSGTSSNAGILGMGQYKNPGYQIDPNAFQNPELDRRDESFANALTHATVREAPTMSAAQVGPAAQMQAAQIDQSQQGQFRGREMGLADQLTAQANGQGPSVAQGQLQTATDRNMAQAMALQASGRGNNNGGMRQAALAQSQMGADAARASGELRASEAMSARQQLAGVLGQGRQADIGLASNQAQLGQMAAVQNQQATNAFAQQQAQLNQQAGTQNQEAALRQTGMNDQMAQFYNQGLMGMDIKRAQARQDLQNLQVQQTTGLSKANADAYIAASKARGGALSGIGQMLGAGGGMFGGMFGGGGTGGAGSGASGAAPGGLDTGGSSGSGDYQGDGNMVEQGAPGPATGASSGPSSSMNYSPAQPRTNDDPMGQGYLTGNYNFMNYNRY